MPLLQSCCSSALYYRLRTQALHICCFPLCRWRDWRGMREDEFWTRLDSSKTSTQLNWGRFVSRAWLWRLTRFLHQPKQESSACSQAIAYVTLILIHETRTIPRKGIHLYRRPPISIAHLCLSCTSSGLRSYQGFRECGIGMCLAFLWHQLSVRILYSAWLKQAKNRSSDDFLWGGGVWIRNISIFTRHGLVTT